MEDFISPDPIWEVARFEVAFTKEELSVFEKWFDNGDDVTDNSWYSLWLTLLPRRTYIYALLKRAR